jgi:hypothetical protein
MRLEELGITIETDQDITIITLPSKLARKDGDPDCCITIASERSVLRVVRLGLPGAPDDITRIGPGERVAFLGKVLFAAQRLVQWTLVTRHVGGRR